ncbi:MAG: AAA family ATPase [Cyanobacteria bacterium P01_A01_bin.70]
MAGNLGDNSGRAHSDDELLQHNQASLQELQTVLRLSAGEFSLTLATCNYHRLRHLVNQQLAPAGLATVMQLPRDFTNLRETIHGQLQGQTPAALLVVGLDYLSEPQQRAVLQGANLSRDGFRQQFPFPLVLWMNRRVQQQFARYAPDFRSFSPSAIPFTLPAGELVHALKAGTDQLFLNILARGGDRELNTSSIRLMGSDALRSELEFALQDLVAHDVVPDPSLQASLDFLQGREAHSQLEMATAQMLYERSLAFWQAQVEVEESATPLDPTEAPEPLTAADKRAVLWLHLGLWWRSNAVVQRVTYTASLRQARRYFEQLVTHFRDRDQTLHLARFIHVLAEVLQKQRDWETLAAIANEGVRLHQETQDPVRLARDHGFLAEVALIKEDWLTAQSEAQQALDILEAAQTALDDSRAADHAAAPADVDLANALAIAASFQRGWYRFLLGEARMHLADPEAALQYLEAARRETDPEVDLTLHLKVLNELIDHYFVMGAYGAAFEIKQKRRQVEYRYSLRAFIGAGAVQPHQRPSPAKQFDEITQAAVAAEIRASGRLQDVEALVSRLQSNQHSIIIVHGPSGVGKSSILTAGLLPRLRSLYPRGRTTEPILVQTYGNWQQAIAQNLDDALAAVGADEEQPEPSDLPTPTPAELMERLREGIEQNRFYVLIFDQFEEFFFDKEALGDRRLFYDFLQQCIDLPSIKVVLALREDYLHHLLEAERIINRVSPDWDLLSKDVRYALANFTPTAAEEVIRQLTAAAQYPLRDELVQRLVADLAAETGDVRPIELQVVGAQLQRDDITTLAQYEALGELPKQTLVQNYLASVVHDCGPPNERLAWVVLYLLTDEDREQRLYRPLKTREEIEYELQLLEMPFDSAQLSLAIEILVGSGLVFEIPEEPETRYQLVHDYLVRYVRDVQTPRLMTELTAAREREREALIAKQAADKKATLFLTEKNEALALKNSVLLQRSKELRQLLILERVIFASVALSSVLLFL